MWLHTCKHFSSGAMWDATVGKNSICILGALGEHWIHFYMAVYGNFGGSILIFKGSFCTFGVKSPGEPMCILPGRPHSFFCFCPQRMQVLCSRVVCPYVRLCIHPRSHWKPWFDFVHAWPRDTTWGVDVLIKFWTNFPQCKGQKPLNLSKKIQVHNLMKTLR